MLVEQPAVQSRLRGLVFRLSNDLQLRDDLFQEASLHLWQRELQRPGQMFSWYLQSCHGHLLDYLRHGRSIDSHKRRHGRRTIEDNGGDDDSPSLDSAMLVESDLALLSMNE